jgi:glycosyltransferase involved in cell wall biosynthesis
VGGELVNAQPELQSHSAPAQRTVLLIAYHFPPLKGSSGMQRTLRFAQHLPKYGWRPIVLSINPRAYEETAQVAGNEVPADLTVHRAFGFNAATQLALFGRYPKALALPDRWATWRFWAVPKALKIIREEGVDAIWSTFPVSTAHLIGLELAKRTGLPWVAEFRDPMWQHDWPPDPTANRVWLDLEHKIFARADWTVFTAPSAIDLYGERFPHLAAERRVLIENGFDEETFRRAEEAQAGQSAAIGTPSSAPIRATAAPQQAETRATSAASSAPRQAQMRAPTAANEAGGAASRAISPTPEGTRTASRPITLLHSGIIYRSERDPTQFFAAVASLKKQGRVDAKRLQIVLRASGAESNYTADLQRLDIADIVRLEPAIDYMAALREMLTVDGLLVLQAANCNAQVPAKLYEYLRARRPILALTDPAGDTARTLDKAGTGLIAPLDDVAAIEAALPQFIAQVESNTGRVLTRDAVARYSRAAKTEELARLLERAVQVKRAAG